MRIKEDMVAKFDYEYLGTDTAFPQILIKMLLRTGYASMVLLLCCGNCFGEEENGVFLPDGEVHLNRAAVSIPPITEPHPRLIVNQATLELMKDRVAAGEEPWYSQAINEEHGVIPKAVSYLENPLPANPYTGLNSKRFLFDVRDQGRRALDLALGYHLTENDSMAEVAISYLRDWATMEPIPGTTFNAFGTCGISYQEKDEKDEECRRNEEVEAGVAELVTCESDEECIPSDDQPCPELCYFRYTNSGMDVARGIMPFALSYDLLYNHPLMGAEDKNAIEAWFLALVPTIQRGIKRWDTLGYYAPDTCHEYNNHQVAHTLGLAVIGYVTGESWLAQLALDSPENPRDFIELIEGMIYMPGEKAQCPKENDTAPAPQKGEIVDRYRHYDKDIDGKLTPHGLSYSRLVLNQMTLLAEIYKNNEGFDAYSYVAPTGEKLEHVFDFYSEFYRTRNSSIKGGFYSGESFFGDYPETISLLEVGHANYPDNQNISFALDSVDRRFLKEAGYHVFDCWDRQTLTHGQPVASPAWATIGEFYYDFDSWSAKYVTNFRFATNTISGEPANEDPRISRENLAEMRLHANMYPEIQFRMALSEQVDSNASFFWRTTENGGWTSQRHVPIDTSGKRDGMYHIYSIPMENLTQWTGYLDGIRIDPMSSKTVGAKFWIDWVRLVPSVDPSIGEFKGTFDDWRGRKIIEFGHGTNTISGRAIDEDPYIYRNDLRDLNLLASRYEAVQVRMRIEPLSESVGTSSAELYWSTTMSEDHPGFQHSLTFDTTTQRMADGYHIYTIPTEEVPGWAGYLTGIRLDPMTSDSDANKKFWIDWVRLVRNPDVP